MFPTQPSKARIWLARGIAVAADALQLVLFPLFIVSEPMEVALDAVVSVAMILLVGWHIAFIPSIIIKALPITDLAPTWTIAVFIATRGGGRKPVVARQI